MLDDDFVSRGRSLERYRLIAVGRERGEEAQKTRRKKELLVRMRNRTAVVVSFVSAFVSIFCDRAAAYNVLMATMGGTKSHTIPFVALGISLKTRGHNVTLLSAFPGPAASNGLQEFVPPIFQVIRTPISFLHPLFLMRTLFEILIYSLAKVVRKALCFRSRPIASFLLVAEERRRKGIGSRANSLNYKSRENREASGEFSERSNQLDAKREHVLKKENSKIIRIERIALCNSFM